MKRKILLSLGLASFIFLATSYLAFSQPRQTSKTDLQKKKDQLRKDIELTNRLLDETQNRRQNSMGQLLTLNKQIDIRKELINTISTEISSIAIQIAQLSIQIDSLQKDLARLKKDYAKMVVYAYRNQGVYKKLMFIFASKDFNQAYKRLKYMQQYTRFREKQAEMIVAKQQEINDKLNELSQKKFSKNDLLALEQVEKQTLESKKDVQWDMINHLQEKEKILRRQLAEKQKAEEKVNKAIEDVVRKEIEAAKKKAVAEGKKNVTKSNAIVSATPEAAKLSGDFENNKHRLPWPVDQGVVTSSFGVHPHALLKGIMINNNGIDITASKGSSAKAVFDGTVSAIINIPGANRAIIVRHGEYLSVYSNLDDTFVSMGDKVIARQSIGRVHTDDEEGRSIINLQIWKGEIRLDPTDWLVRR